MATEKGEDIPARPPIPGDLPYREPPVIEGKAEEIHETRFEPTESAEASAGEPSPASMDEVKAAVENALDSNEPPAQPAREAREPEPMVREPSRSWPVWPLALAALIGLLPGLAALWLALQPRQDDTANAVAALRGDVTRLAARVDALEKRPDAGALRDTVAALDKRIASTETLARSAQATADKASSDATAAATTAQSAADRPAATGSAPAAPAPDLSPLQQQIGDADTRIGALDQKLGSLDSRLGALQTKIDQPKTDTRALTADKDTENAAAENPAALAVVAQSVQQALTRGTPYPTELSALKSLKADPTKIAALEPLAPTGAPTARILAERFRPPADEIAKEDQPREGSFFDRIAQSASHLVRVRSAGEKPGSDPAAVASQIQAALDRGDVARAHDLWTKLPDRAKARAADFGRVLEARVAADNAAQALASESIARFAKPRS
jgi:predicted  nucleic acid-binding Zn-ribbon protein